MERESRNPTRNWHQKCLVAVRSSLGVTNKYGSALDAWNHTKLRRGKGTPPPGVPVYWGGAPYGHVALSAGGGKVWSNDIKRDGGIDLVDIDEITRKWGKPYYGWAEDVNDVDVYDEGGIGGVGTGAPGGGRAMSPIAAQQYARAHLGQYGWGADQMASLIQLWNHESGWKYKNANPKSSARGIPQAMMSAHFGGKNWQNNPDAKRFLSDAAYQVDWGLKYIKSTYGSPANAWNVWQKQKWYADGGIATGPRTIGVGERGPEAIIPLNDRGVDALTEALSRANRQRKRTGRDVEHQAAMRARTPVNVTLHMPIQMAAGSTQVDAEKLVERVVTALRTNDRLAAVMAGD
jgi:hypothetical protein